MAENYSGNNPQSDVETFIIAGSGVLPIDKFLFTKAFLSYCPGKYSDLVNSESMYGQLAGNSAQVITLPSGGAGKQESLVNEIDRQVFKAKTKKVRLIGHSLGGFIATELALKRPESVTESVAIATPFSQDLDHWMTMDWLIGHEMRRALEYHVGTIKDEYHLDANLTFIASDGDELAPVKDTLFLDLQGSQSAKRLLAVSRANTPVLPTSYDIEKIAISEENASHKEIVRAPELIAWLNLGSRATSAAVEVSPAVA